MRSTVIDRRRFLATLGACASHTLASAAVIPGKNSGLPAADAKQAGLGEKADGFLYLAARKHEGRFESVLMDHAGCEYLTVAMPDRGHSFAIDAPRGRVVAFGRQPGFFAIAFDVAGLQAPRTLHPAQGRHFYGHGVFSPDGRRMFATENDFDEGRGVVGIYDASEQGDFRRIGEFSTAGTGPHEVVLMRDGRTLCVANGGILTHPDYGKLQLNSDTMVSSLAYIDSHTGVLLEQVFLPSEWHRLSLRHLVLDSRGDVWFGCQHTGPAHERPGLVGRHRRGTQIGLLPAPEETLRGMKNYIGSLACDAAGTTIATSSPVGGRVMFWDASSGASTGSTSFFDGCGVAPASQGGFFASSGQGTLARVCPGASLEVLAPAPRLAWDNHLRYIGIKIPRKTPEKAV